MSLVTNKIIVIAIYIYVIIPMCRHLLSPVANSKVLKCVKTVSTELVNYL